MWSLLSSPKQCLGFQKVSFTVPQGPLSHRLRPPGALQRAPMHAMKSIPTNDDSGPIYPIIDPTVTVEEESIPTYKSLKYYPVSIGEIMNKQYQVITKLGYGASSTVWLCRDLRTRKHVALKVYVSSLRPQRELLAYKHLSQLASDHAGQRCIRSLLDSFEITGPHGQHHCLVHEPLGMSLHDLKMRARGRVFSKEVLKTTIRQLLGALDYLHTEAHLVHTDLQPSNLLMGITDESVLPELEKVEEEHPTPRKVLPDRTIYLSRPLPLTFGPPVLCDLGEARSGDEENREDIMPDVYRAPEVIFGMKWSYPVDLWNVAMVIWDLFEPSRLFNGKDCKNEYDYGRHIAEMVAILGSPPLAFLERSDKALRFFDEQGKWRNLLPIPETSLEGLEVHIEPGEEKDRFLTFMRKMLRWMPEERISAGELIFDDWLMEGLFDELEG